MEKFQPLDPSSFLNIFSHKNNKQSQSPEPEKNVENRENENKSTEADRTTNITNLKNHDNLIRMARELEKLQEQLGSLNDQAKVRPMVGSSPNPNLRMTKRESEDVMPEPLPMSRKEHLLEKEPEENYEPRTDLMRNESTNEGAFKKVTSRRHFLATQNSEARINRLKKEIVMATREYERQMESVNLMNMDKDTMLGVLQTYNSHMKHGEITLAK